MSTDIITEISKSIGKKKVLKLSGLLAAHNFDITELMDLTFNADKGIAFRAAWLLENLILKNPETFVANIPQLIARFKDVTNSSCKRHYAKMLMHLTSPRAPQSVRSVIHHTNLEPAIEQCFDWLIDPQVMVAVKAHAAEALFNMRIMYPWIADELPAQLAYLMKEGSQAMQSRGRKLLSYLEPD